MLPSLVLLLYLLGYLYALASLRQGVRAIRESRIYPSPSFLFPLALLLGPVFFLFEFAEYLFAVLSSARRNLVLLPRLVRLAHHVSGGGKPPASRWTRSRARGALLARRPVPWIGRWWLPADSTRNYGDGTCRECASPLPLAQMWTLLDDRGLAGGEFVCQPCMEGLLEPPCNL